MNSAFLSSELSRNLEFRLNFECTINGITQESIYHESLRRSGIKVDTGAHGILIPLKTLGWLQSDIDLLVEWYLMNDRSSFTVIHGVESSNKITNAELQNMSNDEIWNYQGLGIRIVADRIRLNDLELENQPVRVTTRTTGSILLGMDIIQRWDCHIGKDNKDKTSLIACPQDAPEKIWNDYCEELETRFSIRRM